MSVPFAKLQGAGNGYVVIDARGRTLDLPALARAICDSRLGVGSNGLACIAESSIAPIRMRIFNSDGSEAEMSGNGIRLFAKFVLDRGIAQVGPEGLVVETGGGLRTVWPKTGAAGVESARVAMGRPTFEPVRIPFDPRRVAVHRGGSAISLDLLAPSGAQRRIDLFCLAIGNPHAVAILDSPVGEFPLHALGPQVMEHPAFPNRINFEIVNVLAPDRIRARIFERGEGETPSSGTGSTAAVIAARRLRALEPVVRVELPGGTLTVDWDGENEAFLDGPTVEVFTGTWPEPSRGTMNAT